MYAVAPTNQRYADLTMTVSAGSAVISVVAEPTLHHTGGAMHGAHYFKLLDDACFFAANSLVPDVFVLTASFNIQLLAPVVGGALTATGEVLRAGRNLIFAEGRLVDGDGKLLATGSGTFARSRLKLAEIEGYLEQPDAGGGV